MRGIIDTVDIKTGFYLGIGVLLAVALMGLLRAVAAKGLKHGG